MRVGIMGAGAVGCFVGGKLVPHVEHVTFVGRRPHGITLGGLDEPTVVVKDVDYRTETEALAEADVVLVAVKSGQTTEVGHALAKVVRRGAPIVSLQNGVRNAEALRAAMPDHRVIGGIVEFNVVAEDGVYRRGTTGGLVLESDPGIASALRAAGIPVEVPEDFRAKQWTKLVINLSNALGAVCDRPTRAMLQDRELRRILRDVMREALDVLDAAGIPTARIGRVPVSLFPRLLGMPSWLFSLLARAQLRIDPGARSSMWQDLSAGRRTEIDELNGEIVRVAEGLGRRAPFNARLVTLVREAEGKGPPALGAAAIRGR